MNALGSILVDLLNLYLIVIILQVVLSWFPESGQSTLTTVKRLLYALTEPVYGPLRRVIPSVGGGGMRLDLSPLIVLLVIELILIPVAGSL